MGEEQVFLTQSYRVHRVHGESEERRVGSGFGVSEFNVILPQNCVSVKENVSGADTWG